MNEERIYKVLVTENGEQIPVQAAAGITVGIYPQEDSVVEEITLDVTPGEFADLQKMADTNSIPSDILKEKEAIAPL